jgi:hypothetical protein
LSRRLASAQLIRSQSAITLWTGPPTSAGSSFARPAITSWLTATCRRRAVSIRSSARSRTGGWSLSKLSSPHIATAASSVSSAAATSIGIECMFECYAKTLAAATEYPTSVDKSRTVDKRGQNDRIHQMVWVGRFA